MLRSTVKEQQQPQKQLPVSQNPEEDPDPETSADKSDSVGRKEETGCFQLCQTIKSPQLTEKTY